MKPGNEVGREPPPDVATYTYAGMGYPNSDAPTSIGNGTATTSLTYDSNGNVAQWFDYAPYGSVLATTNTGATKAARGYIGQFTDDSGLNYLNARYFNSAQGQFTSQDPTFLALGNQTQLKQISQQDQQRFLSDPQQMNSYSYGRDNPITQKDPTGNITLSNVIEFMHYAKTAIDTGNFSLNTNSYQTDEQINEGFGSAMLGLITSAGSYLAEGEARFWLALGSLGGEADQAAYHWTCANLVACQSYFNTGVHVTLLSPGGPAIQITPTTQANGTNSSSGASGGGANGPVQGTSQPSGSSNRPAQQSSSGGSGYINSPGLLPRSAAPVGQYGGQPVYCWGYCGH